MSSKAIEWDLVPKRWTYGSKVFNPKYIHGCSFDVVLSVGGYEVIDLDIHPHLSAPLARPELLVLKNNVPVGYVAPEVLPFLEMTLQPQKRNLPIKEEI